ncbi:MAG: type II secretion system secretin GspD [Halothiobacillaceae bacterium]
MSLAVLVLLVAQAPARGEGPAIPPGGVTVAGNGMVTLNLRDADLEALIATVSEVTGKNFIIDPRVKAKVNLISAKPMPPNELYNVLLSVLQVHGFAAVPKGEVIKIVPDVNAKQDGVEVGPPTKAIGADELVTEVVTLRHVQAAPLLTALRQLMPQQAALSVHPESNSLILTDRAGNVARMKDILARVDHPGSDEIETIRLEHASATDIVKTLTQLRSRMGPSGTIAAAHGGTPGGDTPSVGGSFAADERTNSVLLSGDKTEREKLRAVVVYLDTPLERAGNTQVFYLKYARARDLMPILQGSNRPIAREGSATVPGASSSGLGGGMGTMAAGSAGVNAGLIGVGGRQDAIVIADEATNALVITAPPNVMREMESIIKQLDIRRAQVLVEAIIAEVSDDFSRKLGVQMAALGQDGTQPAGVVSFNGLLSAITGAAAGGGAAIASAALANLGDGMNFGVGDFSGNTRFGVIVSALAGDANNNILSTPSLLTMDNQEASIVVGKNVPILTGAYASTGAGTTPTTPFQTISREDIGVKLKVKPSISPEGAVRLELEQEVSSIDATAKSDAGLITNKRNVKTVVQAQDGDIVVLGGLMDETVNDQASKVPLLGDIPLVGELFKYRSTTRGKRNLMIFIRPVVLRDGVSANRYTAEKYNAFREKQIEFSRNPLGFAVPSDYPLLPQLDGYQINLPSGTLPTTP